MSAIVCLAAFAGTCLALHAVLPPPDVGDVSPKLRFFAAHKDEFETVFVGSSHIHYGVSPSVFDEVLTQPGFRIAPSISEPMRCTRRSDFMSSSKSSR
jgi:hypothetical protein